jgi:hypothetical protein
MDHCDGLHCPRRRGEEEVMLVVSEGDGGTSVRRGRRRMS